MASRRYRYRPNRMFTFTAVFLLSAVGGIIIVNGALAKSKPALSAEAEISSSPPSTRCGNHTPCRPHHKHPAFSERGTDREKMVNRQIYGRGIRDPETLSALQTVPRHAFVRPGDQRRAYSDQPLPIGYGQTISQPYIVAYMTEALDLQPDFKVLEIGTGSAYQAAVCAEIVREVFTIEIVEPLAASARKRLEELGYPNAAVKAGDGYYGWPENAPFDAIIVTAAAGFVPPPLIEQLKPGGRMILPLGSPYGLQILVLITKDETGKLASRRLLPVRFVPMLGKVTEPGPEK